MQNSDRNIQQDNKEKPMSFTIKCILIGFWGGLLTGIAGYFAYLLNFTKFGPALIFAPLTMWNWGTGPVTQLSAILIIAFISILVALLYKIVMAKWYSMWGGIIYGVFIWILVFYVLNLFFPKIDPVTSLDINTLVTTMSLYIIYGLFIGYSICFDYHELNAPSKKKSKQDKLQNASES